MPNYHLARFIYGNLKNTTIESPEEELYLLMGFQFSQDKGVISILIFNFNQI
jgi:hypothetical protein